VFRVCQEAINNIAKHSLATQISVAIKRQDGSVNFCIKDNGVGFDLDQFSQEDLSEKGMGVAAVNGVDLSLGPPVSPFALTTFG
jgi:two-component system NarL family sensor kinase